MSEIGATNLSGSITSIFDAVRKKMDDAQSKVNAAATVLMTEVAGYDAVASSLTQEAAKVRTHVNSLLGNNPPPERKTIEQP